MYYISSSNTIKATLEHKVMYTLPKIFAIISAGHFMNELPLKFADKKNLMLVEISFLKPTVALTHPNTF